MFSDLHHDPGIFYNSSVETIKTFHKAAVENGCSFMLHAGDLCSGPSLRPDLMEALDNGPIPTYHCLGNHDTDKTAYEEVLKIYHMPNGHYHFDTSGYRFVVLDPNYCLVDGEYIHYDLGNYFKWGEFRDHTPPEQLVWLEETIETSPYPCILVSHDSYERESEGAKEAKSVQEIIRKVNAKSPHKVLMVMNGHYHRDNLRILDNVLYWDINSVWMDWVGKNDCHLYPDEYYEKYSAMDKAVYYSDPLYAIVTIEGNTITIEGKESSMLFGVQRKDTGRNQWDSDGRASAPRIQSAKLTLL